MTETTIAPPEESPDCACGALLKPGQIHCSKCLARQRWERLEKARRRTARRRSITRRPPRGPVSAAAIGVIWS
ncbi:hypothetical protein [Microbispora catharanthi]|uniref:Uncharacterized protein n=1 Tax=Microbispora catharanthi TaxID=1712871 RepID=A0A5N6BCS7_9ACTN|nr:hypothetical protein [Microbispora catharanthi]KAB8178346.1 hypothetical protein FH610_036890 [Microbispora catharanthi]